MPLSLQELASTTVQYSPTETFLVSFMTLLSGTGALMIVLILIPIATRIDSPSTTLVISHLTADALFCASVFIMFLVNAIRMEWSWGAEGCLVNAICTIASVYTSVLSILIVSIDRYASCVFSSPLNPVIVYTLVCLIWTVSWVIIGPLTLYTNHYHRQITLQESRIYCSVTWHLNDPEPSMYVFVGSVLLLLTFFTIVFSFYHLITIYISKTRTATEGFASSNVSQSMAKSVSKAKAKPQQYQSERERELMLKGVVMASTFFVCWSPLITKILIAYFTRKPVEPIFDTFCAIGVLTYCAASPVIIYFMDHRVRQSVHKWYPFLQKVSDQ
jgi:hypothetical protein